ncbi:Ig-like domain-containing protein [Exiguobacterium aurantiacum]
MLLVFSSFDWRVLGAEDIEPPVIVSHTFPAKEYTVGDRVPIEVRATDNKSLALRVYLYVKTPKTGKSISIKMNPKDDGSYTGELNVTDTMESGRYKLSSMTVYDEMDNTTTIYGQESTQWFDISGTKEEDTEPPVIVSHTFPAKEFTVGDRVPIEVRATDNKSLALRVYLYVKTPKTGKSISIKMNPKGDGSYTGELNVTDTMESGRYKLSSMTVYDEMDNTTTIYGQESTQWFDISGTKEEDTEPPVIVSHTFPAKEFTVGDRVPIEVRATDNKSLALRVYLYVKTPKTGKSISIKMNPKGDGSYTGELNVTDTMESGRYKLSSMTVYDEMDNTTTIYGQESTQWFEVRSPLTDSIKPVFGFIETKKIMLEENEYKSFSINASDDLKLMSAVGTFTHENGETITLSSETVTSTGFDFPVSYDSFWDHPGQWKLTSLTISDLNQNTVTVTEGLDVSINVLPTIDPINARIVSGYETWSYETINQDVYILPGAHLNINSNVQINGNVYVGGRLRSYGGLDLNGEIRANYFTFGYYNPYQDGMVVLSGSNSINSMTATNQLYGTLPFQISGAPLFEENGTVDVAGSFIPLSTLYLNGEAVTTKANGIFRLTDVVVPEDKTLRFSMMDQYGKTHRWTYKVYSRDLPVVTASLPSGIYPKGESVTLEATKDATIYYTLNENAEPFTYGGPIQLDSSITLGYHAIDEIELASASETKRYEVFNVHAVENDDEAIRGQAEPGTALTLTLGESTYTTTATPDGTFAFTNLTLDSHGDYELNLQHGLLQSKPYTGVIKDVIAPIITGVTNDAYTSSAVTLTFNEGVATLNGQPVSSGTKVTADGTYTLIVTDQSGNSTTRQFTVDTKAPVVSGISSRYTNKNVTLTFNEGSATLNGKAVASGMTVSTEGDYELVVRDKAGNETKTSFTIDRTPVAITGAEEGNAYKQARLQFTEGKATLNGQTYVSGTLIEKEGTYAFRVIDLTGNEVTINFTIDRTAPNVTGVMEGILYNKSITPVFNEGTATLNGKAFVSGQAINQDGTYELVVTDAANNITKRSFRVDKTAPVVTGVKSGAINRAVTPTFDEGTATLNGKPYTSGTVINQEGSYELIVTDSAKNVTRIQFLLDWTPIKVNGIEEGKTYKEVTPTFDEGNATLSGQPYASGTAIVTNGEHTLIVTDEAGNETTIRFTIDNTPPVLTGFTTGKAYYRSVAPRFDEGTATLNGEPYTSGKLISQPGKYTLRLSDATGNETVTTFTIDRTAPVISGVKSRQVTNQSVTIQYNEGTATLNGKRIRNNWPVKNSGAYTLRVTDQAGNVKSLSFTIDKVAPKKPTVSTLTNKSTYVSGKAEKGATVYITYNGRTYTTKASSTGSYRYNVKTTKTGVTVSVRVRDAAGNTSSSTSVKVLNTFRTFTVNSVKSTSNVIIGKGNKGATVQAYVGTKLISKIAKVDSKGNYKLTISRQKPGVVVTVKMTQSGYQEMKKTTRVVK